METHSPSEMAQVLEQAEAAVAAQNDPTTPTSQHDSLQEFDLINPDSFEDDPPPPAYGESHGEIHSEKHGLGTRAIVTDDGRVDIRINQLNRRLSQIFTPALHQQLQSVQDGHAPPEPYIPPSLGGEEGVRPPPPLNVVIQVVGSRGDVQPFIALGKVLKDTYGHRVRLATHPNFKTFVQQHDLEFFSIGGDPSGLMSFMVKNPGLMPGFRSIFSGDVSRRKRDVADYIQGCWRSCYQAGDGNRAEALKKEPVAKPFVADCIIANPPSFAHIHCAEKLGIPLHIMFTMPYSPTQSFPHPLANIQSSNADPQLTNYISYAMIELLSWQGLGDIINRFRTKCLNLDPISRIWAPGLLQRLKIPHTYCWSPALMPKPKDWAPHISISGFYFLDTPEYTPSNSLQTFLNTGPTPIYVGFGSIVLDDPNTMTELIFEAVKKTGQRVVLSKGWARIGADDLPENVFMLDDVPHDWLFRQVSCVVHHGGAGTTAAGIAAGRPTVVIPFFGDQPFWGAVVARAGAGPDPIPHRQLTAAKLADAITFCLRPESLERAKELARKIEAERGSDMGALSFHRHLEPDRLRCSLAPSRAAAWSVKGARVQLSTFAASTLANANLLDFHDLKLFRPQEYVSDEGPWDPISGGSAAVFGAFSNMVMGVADFPAETWKALNVLSRRKQSQTTVPTMRGRDESSLTGEGSSSSALPEQSQTSLGSQDSIACDRTHLYVSELSSSTSKSGPSSTYEASQEQSNGKRDNASQILSPSRDENEYGSSEEHDIMQTVAHTSKGFGRIVKAAVEAPMEMSIAFTKGFHNTPKLWGDDTVRPQQEVSDLKSGFKAIGKEFGFGFYDGITGLVTQPWKGALKEGTAGFFKGMGKGIGGFVTKPGAALFGVPAYFMKGSYKEMQNLFRANVQNYIVASRVTQGYEEWLHSSDAEKQDVVARWKLIQKYMKKKQSTDDMMRDILEAQRGQNNENADACRDDGSTASLAQRADCVDAATDDVKDAMHARADSPMSEAPASASSEESLRVSRFSESIRFSSQDTPFEEEEEDPNVEQTIQRTVSQLQRQQQEAADHRTDQENLRQAIAASEAEHQQYAREALEYEAQLKRVIAQSLGEQRQRGSDNTHESGKGVDDNRNVIELAGQSVNMVERVEGMDGGSQPGEKTMQERTEEEILMEYVKKQSILESRCGDKGKRRAITEEEVDNEDLQEALKLSMQEHADRSGESSGV